MLLAACGGRTNESGYAGPKFDEVDPTPQAVVLPETALRTDEELAAKVPSLPPGSFAKRQIDDLGNIISEGFYCDNFAVGHWVTFADGQIASAGRYNYGGVRVGLWAYWTEAGQLQMVGDFGDFEREKGMWTYYHANGVISAGQNA